MRSTDTLRIFRRAGQVLMSLLVVAGLLVATSSTASAATLTRESKNKCGAIVLTYNWVDQHDGTFWIQYFGDMEWRADELGCGDLRDPYAPVLQWKGLWWGESFDWEVAPNGYGDANGLIKPTSGYGFADVRFRLCNWNTDTGFVGTCGTG